MISSEDFLKKWLKGTTCYDHKRLVVWESDCGNYVVLKHCGHSEWGGRWSPSEWCGTHYNLYDLREKTPDVFGEPYLWKKEGRWNKSCLKEIQKIINERKNGLKTSS